MTTWTDHSDSRGRFFDGGEWRGRNVDESLHELFTCLVNDIIERRIASPFDLLMFEVNCDTGRLIAVATTAGQYAGGFADGCSLRVQEVQDHWYDLLESGISEEQFSLAIRHKVDELGGRFRDLVTSHLEVLRQKCSSKGFVYRVLGSDSDFVVHEEAF